MRRRERIFRLVGALAFPREWWRRHGGEVTDTALRSPAPGKELAGLVPAGLSVRTRGYGTNARGEGWVVDGARFGVLVALVVGFAACQGVAYTEPSRLANTSLARFVVDFAWLAAIVAVGRRRDTLGAVMLSVPAALATVIGTAATIRAVDSPLRDPPAASLPWLSLMLWTGVAALLILRVWSRGVVRRSGSVWWIAAPFVLIGLMWLGGLPVDAADRDVERQVAILAAMGLFALIGFVRLWRDPSWAVAAGLAFAAHGVGTVAWTAGRLGDGGATVLAVDALGVIATWSAAALAPRIVVATPGVPDRRAAAASDDETRR